MIGYYGRRYRRNARRTRRANNMLVTAKRRYYNRKPSRYFKRNVMKVLGSVAEKKYHDVQVTTTMDTSGAVQDLVAISQGTTDTTREGDNIYLKSLQVRGYVTVGDAYNVIRVIIFQWFMDTAVSGSSPTISNILQSIAGGYGPINPFTHDSHTQYRILFDRTFIPDSDDPAIPFEVLITRFPKHQVQYTAAGTGGANKIYIAYISDSSAVAHPGIVYNTRVNFLDM